VSTTGAKPIRVRIPSPISTRLVLVGSLAAGAIAAIASMLEFIAWSDVCIWLGMALASTLMARFSSWGSLEFSSNGKTLCYVSEWRREFSLYSMPVVLDAPEHIVLSPGSEVLICRENAFESLQVSVRIREPEGTEHLVGTVSTVLNHKQAEKLVQSITQKTGLPARSCERQRDATGEHEKEWDRDWEPKHLRELLYTVPSAFLPCSGFVVRALTASTGVIVAIGFVLMALEGVLMWQASPPSSNESNSESIWTFGLLLALYFPIPYLLSVLLTPVLLAHRLK
jgi:hypothetical protein